MKQRIIFGLAVLCCAAAAQAIDTSKQPSAFKDALAVWHLENTDDATGNGNLLKVSGEVALGVELAGQERADSVTRGGDGKVAIFKGGYLDAGVGVNGQLDPTGQTLTICLRVRDPEGKWDTPLFGKYGAENQVSYYLQGTDGARKPFKDRNRLEEIPTFWSMFYGDPNGPLAIKGNSGLVEFIWGTEPNSKILAREENRAGKTGDCPIMQEIRNGVMKVACPVAIVGPTVWHDIIIRFTGPKLELFVDGVLMDVEFPIGGTRANSAIPCLIGAGYVDGTIKAGFQGVIDHVALWSRALSDAEILQLSGGAESATKRKVEYLGPEPANMQYFRTPGYNCKAGDSFPFFHDGTFHLYYLNLRRNMHSKWDSGHGALEIFHASTRDLKTWTHHPVAVPISEQWEDWNGTGATAFLDGTYYMYYPCRSSVSDKGGIQLATSTDGINFTKHPQHPYMPGGDLDIYKDEETGLFNLIKRGPLAPMSRLTDKTLVAWVSLATLDQRGGSVLTLVDDERGSFDGIVYGEAVPGRWMAGSEGSHRTQRDQQANPAETATLNEVIQIAAVYRDKAITLYRNGQLYASYSIKTPQAFEPDCSVVVGVRHLSEDNTPTAYFNGAVHDVRIYGQALSPKELVALAPKRAAGPEPLAWWDFANDQTVDRMNRFLTVELTGEARVVDGKLCLPGVGSSMIASRSGMTQMVRLTSRDLKNWEQVPEPFLVTRTSYAPNLCPRLFKWNDWYYFNSGLATWMSRKPFGPWTLHTPLRLDSLSVPKAAAFTGNRRICVGFSRYEGWGMNLVFRELIQNADGTLGTKFPPEMIPASGKTLSLPFTAVKAETAQEKDKITVKAPGGFGIAMLTSVPRNVRVTCLVTPQPGVSTFGLALCGSGEYEKGYEVLFIPSRKQVRTGEVSAGNPGRCNGESITVTDLDRPFTLDIIVKEDIVDVEIDRRRTLLGRYWNPESDRLFFFAGNGEVTFSDLQVRPLINH
jgi:hypothetical protein